MTNTLANTNRYKKFVAERDRVLESILNNCLIDCSRLLNEGLTRTLEIISHSYAQMPQVGFFTQDAIKHRMTIQHRLEHAMQYTSGLITGRVFKLRRRAYALTRASEAEAISRATGDAKRCAITKPQLDGAMLSKTAQDEHLIGRGNLTLAKIVHKVMIAIETSRVKEESLDECLTRVKQAFPKAVRYKRGPKPLKRILESDRKRVVDLARVEIDEHEWNEMLFDYLHGPEIAPTRFYNEPIDVEDADTGDLETRYAWEFEQEATHDFVSKVREGQSDEAKQQGIKDFVWIAVIDSATDDCCRWRDGLTTKEIRAELRSKHLDDECDAEVPPAHFNCRCTLAPVGDVPERIELDLGEFEEWLAN